MEGLIWFRQNNISMKLVKHIMGMLMNISSILVYRDGTDTDNRIRVEININIGTAGGIMQGLQS